MGLVVVARLGAQAAENAMRGLEEGMSSTSRQQALALATQAHIPIYDIGVGAQIDRAFLSDLALTSGGAFLEVTTSSSIQGLCAELSQLLRSQFVITVKSTAPAAVEARSLRLDITTPAGATQARIDYKSRRTIVPTQPPAPVTPPSTVAAEPSGASNAALYALVTLLAATAIGAFLLMVSMRWRRQRRLAALIAMNSEWAAGQLGVVSESTVDVSETAPR